MLPPPRRRRTTRALKMLHNIRCVCLISESNLVIYIIRRRRRCNLHGPFYLEGRNKTWREGGGGGRTGRVTNGSPHKVPSTQHSVCAVCEIPPLCPLYWRDLTRVADSEAVAVRKRLSYFLDPRTGPEAHCRFWDFALYSTLYRAPLSVWEGWETKKRKWWKKTWWRKESARRRGNCRGWCS